MRRDGWLCGEIGRVYDEPFGVYGVRKVWRQLRREGVSVARCTVARLMRRLGLQACPGRGEAGGVVRGRQAKTTTQVAGAERPADRVNRNFTVSRPDALWVSDPRFHHSGAGSDLRGHVARVRLHRLGHRRLRAAHRGLAGVERASHRAGPRCARTGPSRTRPRTRSARPSFRARRAIPVAAVHRALGTGRDRTLGGPGRSPPR